MLDWFKNLFRRKEMCIDCLQHYPKNVMSEVWYRHRDGMASLYLCKACSDDLQEEIDSDDNPLEFDGEEFTVGRYER